ncbi:BLUF domain-containing protein [Limnobacter humi]|uniref:BLUF domain-containing protein n=1 Tax=Limnobacter humi TaxID=1778671 RepID=A0ABT1WIS0_9BURK|nr:BLUF domain-containing protein [Limnobacter humi]MCQ8896931.1 BLUF domain-containing protein [Limnobacter humi]
MHRLVYTSTQAVPLNPEDFERLCEQASSRNQRLGLSGILLFNGQEFLQCLEGDHAQITEVFKPITQDSRHRDIQIHCFGPVADRLFTGWGMQGIHLGPNRPASEAKTAFDYLDAQLHRSWQSLGAGVLNVVMEYGQVKAEMEKAPQRRALLSDHGG